MFKLFKRKPQVRHETKPAAPPTSEKPAPSRVPVQELVITRNFKGGSARYAVNDIASDPTNAAATDVVAIDDAKFVKTWSDSRLSRYKDFGCGLIGKGCKSNLKLVKLKFDGTNFHCETTGTVVSNAKHLFATEHGLFAVINN